jgi:chromosome segregation ATPase
MNGQKHLLDSLEKTRRQIANDFNACNLHVELLLQQPSMKETIDPHDSEIRDLHSKLINLRCAIGNMADEERSVEDAENNSYENARSLSDLLTKLQEENEQLREQTKVLTQRVQAVEIRLSQTNLVVVELERTKNRNEKLRDDLLKMEEMCRSKERELAKASHELQTFPTAGSSRLSPMQALTTDAPLQSNPAEKSGQTVFTSVDDRYIHTQRVEKSLRQFAEELLVSAEHPSRRQSAEALLLTGYGRSEVDKTADHETFSVNTQSVSTQRSDDCHEIEKTQGQRPRNGTQRNGSETRNRRRTSFDGIWEKRSR